MGGTATTSAERRQAHIPLLLHPDPKRALFLGLGTGITFGAAGVHPGLEADGVELLPEVIQVMNRFSPDNGDPWRRPRLRVFEADARRFVRVADQSYDVIVADLFHPAMNGAGALYTREHFRAVRERLTPAGLFCQWLPLHQLDQSMLRIVTRTFLEVFPQAHAYLLRFNIDTPVIGLVGFRERPKISSDWVERWVDHVELRMQLRQLVLADSVQLFGCLLADSRTLMHFAQGAPDNTDDLPRIIFEAPATSYRAVSPHERLFALLDTWRLDLHAVLGDSSYNTEHLIQRVQDFTRARDLYLRGLAAEADQRLSDALDFYLASSRVSPDLPGVTLAASRSRTYLPTPIRRRRALFWNDSWKPNLCNKWPATYWNV
jgi:spermidine synthase